MIFVFFVVYSFLAPALAKFVVDLGSFQEMMPFMMVLMSTCSVLSRSRLLQASEIQITFET